MKLFLKIVLLVITPFLLSAQNYCNLKCETNIDSITGIPIKIMGTGYFSHKLQPFLE